MACKIGCEEAAETDGRPPYLLAVADGMGGHAAGDKAASTAIDTLRQYLNSRTVALKNRSLDASTALVSAFRECHRSLVIASNREADRYGMGTTLTAALLVGRRLSVVHAGDSRLYLLRHGTIEQLTTDHTLANLMQQASPNFDEHTLFSHALWNAVKADHDSVEVDTSNIDLQSADILLLCSDGLTRHVSDDNIKLVLASYDNLEHACQTLVDIANSAGGSDNITIVAARYNFDRAQTAKRGGDSAHRSRLRCHQDINTDLHFPILTFTRSTM